MFTNTTNYPNWLNFPGSIILAEGEEEAPAEGVEPEEGVEDEDLDGNTDGLKSALQKERAARRDAERARKAEQAELAQLRKEREERELADKSEIEKAQARAEKAEQVAKTVAENYVKDSINTAIEKAAGKLKFRDLQDAVLLVNRENISYEQDPDDPSKVTIDSASVEKVVKSLAEQKPHYLQSSSDDDEPTGSSFSRKPSKKDLDDEALKEQYPSLR